MRIWVVAGALLAALLAALAFALAQIDDAVAGAVRDYGPKRLGVPITVASVDVSLADARVELTGVEVANPRGFEAASALALERVTVQIDTSRSSFDRVWVERLVLDGVRLTAEVRRTSEGVGTNLGRLSDRADREAGTRRSRDAAGDGGGRRVVVERLLMTDVSGALVSPFGEVETGLPDMRVEGLGDGSGVGVEEVVAEAIGRFDEAAARALARAAERNFDPDRILDRVKGKLDRFVDRLGGNRDEREESSEQHADEV